MSAPGDIVPLDHSALAAVAPSYERIRVAMAECSRIDEVANLADQAVAAQAYFRQSQDTENEIEASRIRVRAERRLGEILKAMAANGERASRQDTLKQAPMSPGATSAPTLADLGIPRDRASRAMKLADVPEPEFESALAAPRIAQPRRMLDERKPEADGAAPPGPASSITSPSGANIADFGVKRVLAIHAALGRGELPRPEQARATLAPIEIEKLRAALPSTIRYLEQLRVVLCPRCDGEGCTHCGAARRTQP